MADVIQETILHAFEHIRELKKPEYFRTWLVRILMNNCNRVYNQNKKRCSLEEYTETAQSTSNPGDVEFREMLHMREATVKSRLHRGFAGIIRVDLMMLGILDQESGWSPIDNEAIPDAFAYTLKIMDIFADYEGEHLSGNWDFALDVKLNREDTIIKELGETNEQGVGIQKVTRSDYEMYAEPIFPEGKSSTDYCVAICDAEGKPLESQGEYAEVYSIYGRDISKVTIYVVDYITYMDECKGNNYTNLPKKAVYQTEVEF